LKNDQELARRYELVREEQAETVHANEMLGSPSHRPMQNLMAAINVDIAHRQASLIGPRDFVGRIGTFLLGLSPRTLAWSAAAALVLLVAQGALLTSSFVRDSLFETAIDGTARPQSGTFAIVRFNPSATAADIGKFLRTHEASVVDGPKADGLYRLRVSQSPLPRDAIEKLMTRMEQEKAIVGFIAPAE
jgi:hypothetical protein